MQAKACVLFWTWRTTLMIFFFASGFSCWFSGFLPTINTNDPKSTIRPGISERAATFWMWQCSKFIAIKVKPLEFHIEFPNSDTSKIPLTFILIENPVNFTASFLFEFLKSLAFGWRRGHALRGRLSWRWLPPILSIASGLTLHLPSTTRGKRLSTVSLFSFSPTLYLPGAYQGCNVWFYTRGNNTYTKSSAVDFSNQSAVITPDGALFICRGYKVNTNIWFFFYCTVVTWKTLISLEKICYSLLKYG